MFAIVFQFLIAPVALVTFFKDLGDAENRQRKRSRTLGILLFSAAGFFMTGILLSLLRDISQKYIGFPIEAINCLPGIFVELFQDDYHNIGDFFWDAFSFILIFMMVIFAFYLQFIHFLFFWIMFSKNRKRRKFVFAFYLAWCCVNICLMHLCPGVPLYDDAPPPHRDGTSAPAVLDQETL